MSVPQVLYQFLMPAAFLFTSQASSQGLVTELFKDTDTSVDGAANGSAANGPAGRKPVTKGFKFNSVGSQFKKQLGELMAALNKMAPHYVRCVKPNASNKPAAFEPSYVLHQLRCARCAACAACMQMVRFFDTLVDTKWFARCAASLSFGSRGTARLPCNGAPVSFW